MALLGKEEGGGILFAKTLSCLNSISNPVFSFDSYFQSQMKKYAKQGSRAWCKKEKTQTKKNKRFSIECRQANTLVTIRSSQIKMMVFSSRWQEDSFGTNLVMFPQIEVNLTVKLRSELSVEGLDPNFTRNLRDVFVPVAPNLMKTGISASSA